MSTRLTSGRAVAMDALVEIAHLCLSALAIVMRCKIVMIRFFVNILSFVANKESEALE